MILIIVALLAAQPVAPDELVASHGQISAHLMTLERFEKIRLGMTYKDVVSLIGPPTRTQLETMVAGTHLVTYQWGDGGAPLIFVAFQNGRVSMRTQMGLK